MVTVSNYFVRKAQDGKSFVVLEFTGDLELIQSAETGRFYATAKKCIMSSTFPEEVAKTLVGKQIPGKIDRVKCEPYEYVIAETGEKVTLIHTYVYNPDEKPMVLQSVPQNALVEA